MIKCTECNEEKQEDSFSFSNKKNNIKSKRCKDCQNTRSKKHWKENKEQYKERDRLRLEKTRLFVYTYLLSHPCISCGEYNPVVLEFDHRDPTKKEFSISEAVSNRVTIERIQAEIEKCDVLCANCHRIKTAIDYDYYCHTLSKI